MHNFGIPVLRVLDQEYHEKRNYGCGGIDDQLPGVRKLKSRSSEQPYEDDYNGAGKRPGSAQNNRRLMCEDAKCVLHHLEKLSPGGMVL